jgi:hypothetical protein
MSEKLASRMLFSVRRSHLQAGCWRRSECSAGASRGRVRACRGKWPNLRRHHRQPAGLRISPIANSLPSGSDPKNNADRT